MDIKYREYTGKTYYDGRSVVRDFYRNGELYVRIKYYDSQSDPYNKLFGLKYFTVCVYTGEIMIAKGVEFNLAGAVKFGFM